MYTVLVFTFYIIGFVVWFYKKENLPIYCIYLTTFGLIAFEMVSPSLTAEERWDSFAETSRISCNLLLICLFFNLLTNQKRLQLFLKQTFKFWMWLFFGGLYFLLWQNLHDVKAGGGITFMFLQVSSLSIYYKSLIQHPNLNGYKKHFIIIGIIESLFIICNIIIGPLYFSQVLETIRDGAFFISGSFHRFNFLASFIAMYGIIVSFSYFDEKIKFKLYVSLMALVFILLLMTGARMQLVWMVLTVFIIAFSEFKKHKKICITIAILAIGSFFILKGINLKGYSTQDAQSGIERQLYGIVSAINSKSAESGEQTQDISAYMLTNWFDKSPFIGNALGYKEYSYHPNIPTKVMVSDAAFAYILCEYGILGLIFALGIILSAFQVMGNGMSYDAKKKSRLLCVSLFILTITEAGFFETTFMLYIWIYLAWVKYYKTGKQCLN